MLCRTNFMMLQPTFRIHIRASALAALMILLQALFSAPIRAAQPYFEIMGPWSATFNPPFMVPVYKGTFESGFTLNITSTAGGVLSGTADWNNGAGPLDRSEPKHASVSGQLYKNGQVTLKILPNVGRTAPVTMPLITLSGQVNYEKAEISGSITPGTTQRGFRLPSGSFILRRQPIIISPGN
jgi:hypothetical protein